MRDNCQSDDLYGPACLSSRQRLGSLHATCVNHTLALAHAWQLDRVLRHMLAACCEESTETTCSVDRALDLHSWGRRQLMRAARALEWRVAAGFLGADSAVPFELDHGRSPGDFALGMALRVVVDHCEIVPWTRHCKQLAAMSTRQDLLPAFGSLIYDGVIGSLVESEL